MRRFYRLFWFLILSFISASVFAVQPVWVNDNHTPIISEFMASNDSSLYDNNGNASDWCELYNPTSSPINMNGWFLSDNQSALYKFRFPNVTIQPGAYLLIYLSGVNDIGNHNYLHANFKLEASGENLILTRPDGFTKVWYFENGYPEQFPDVSYGIIDGQYYYLAQSTPGKANINDKHLPQPKFSVGHGYFSEPFMLSIEAFLPDATIYYSTDFSEPSNLSKKYTGPIEISKTSIVRAVAYTSEGKKGVSSTASYLFFKDIINQPVLPAGFPAEWGPFTAIRGNAPGDYEMDPDICKHTDYANQMIASLTSLPVVSLVANQGHLFSSSTDPDQGGIYYYTGAPITNFTYDLGKEWRRPASIEYFVPGKNNSFQINCGIKLHGGHSRRPEKSPKHSFRLLFSTEYGPSKLNFPIFKEEKNAAERFNRLLLRGGFNNTWIHADAAQRQRGQYLRDSWTKDAFRAMGQHAAYNQYIHLFINGLYWGMYNISERMDDSYMSDYFGGNREDFDVIKDYTEVSQGNILAWNAMWQLVQGDMTRVTNYMRVLGRNADGTENLNFPRYIDEVSLADYMLVNIFGGNADWDHHNWVAGRNRETRDGFKFLVWDSEHFFPSLNANVTNKNNPNCPSGIFQQLMKSAEFKMLFADRVYKHLFNQGVLTPNPVVDMWNNRGNEVKLAIVAESARWGDYRRDGHPWSSSSKRLYTLNNDWIPANNNMLNNVFPFRTNEVINQLKSADFYPWINPPQFVNVEEIIRSGDKLALLNQTGDIYYTIDGTDPRMIGGAVSGSAKKYNKADSIIISGNISINARCLSSNQWSALAAHTFSLATNSPNLALQNNTLQAKVFPSPVINKLNVELNTKHDADTEIGLYTLTGAKVANVFHGFVQKGLNHFQADVGQIPVGVYFCRINNDKGELEVVKIIVSR